MSDEKRQPLPGDEIELQMQTRGESVWIPAEILAIDKVRMQVRVATTMVAFDRALLDGWVYFQYVDTWRWPT